MASNYKKLGNYIHEIDIRNNDSQINNLVGVSINKNFMPSVANTIGTDLKNYKIISKNQFACSLMQVSRDGGVAISLYKQNQQSIMSPAYYLFEVNDIKELLPEYLELIVYSSEFDREAVFNAIGGVRGTLTWEDFCNLEVNIPDIEEQKKIVREFQTIKSQINAISKENVNLQNLGILNLCSVIGFDSIVNKTEKEISEFELPENCSISTVKDFCKNITSGGTPNRGISEYYNGSINWLKSGEVHNNIITNTEEKISEMGLKNSSAKIFPKNTVLMAMYGVTAGEVGLLDIETSTNQAICGMICNSFEDAFLLYFSLRKNQIDIKRLANGGAQDNLNQDIIKETKIIIPNETAKTKLYCSNFMNRLIINSRLLHQLQKMLDLLLLKIC